MKYKVKRMTYIGTRKYEAGDILEIEKHRTRSLVKIGAIELIKEKAKSDEAGEA